MALIIWFVKLHFQVILQAERSLPLLSPLSSLSGQLESPSAFMLRNYVTRCYPIAEFNVLS